MQGNVNLSNIGEVRSWYSNRIYVVGDFTASDISLLQLDYTGATRDNIYTDSENNGIWINGNMSLTRIGNGTDGDCFYGWNSSFLRVGKSLNLVEMKGHMKFGAIGVLNGQDGGGIEIGENLFVDNRASSKKFEVQFAGSNYMTVGKNVDLYNTTLAGWDMKHVEVGGNLYVADGSGAIFERARDYIKIMGDLTLEGSAAFESRDSGYMYVGGDFSIGTTDVKVGSHKGKDGADASLTNVGLEIGGKINMGGGKLGLFYASAHRRFGAFRKR